jgi:hypothetical protein
MDPDENRDTQRRLAERMLEAEEPHPSDAVRLAELVLALDDWLRAGGFPPRGWRR